MGRKRLPRPVRKRWTHSGLTAPVLLSTPIPNRTDGLLWVVSSHPRGAEQQTSTSGGLQHSYEIGLSNLRWPIAKRPRLSGAVVVDQIDA